MNALVGPRPRLRFSSLYSTGSSGSTALRTRLWIRWWIDSVHCGSNWSARFSSTDWVDRSAGLTMDGVDRSVQLPTNRSGRLVWLTGDSVDQLDCSAPFGSDSIDLFDVLRIDTEL